MESTNTKWFELKLHFDFRRECGPRRDPHSVLPPQSIRPCIQRFRPRSRGFSGVTPPAADQAVEAVRSGEEWRSKALQARREVPKGAMQSRTKSAMLGKHSLFSILPRGRI